MTDAPDPTEQDAAREAAQHVVDEVTSWHHSSEGSTIEGELDAGLEQAGVEVEGGERQRLVEEIADLKRDDTQGTPTVSAADPAESGTT